MEITAQYVVPPIERLSAAEKLRMMMEICNLNVPSDPSQNAAKSLQLLNQSLSSTLKTLPPNYLKQNIHPLTFSPSVQKSLTEINNALREEYKGRKEVLMKRFEATAQTFLWKDELKTTKEDIELKNELLQTFLQDKAPFSTPEFHLLDILTAQRDVLDQATETTKIHTKEGQDVRQFVMTASPPDRGGRTEEKRVRLPTFTERHGAAHDPKLFPSSTQQQHQQYQQHLQQQPPPQQTQPQSQQRTQPQSPRYQPVVKPQSQATRPNEQPSKPQYVPRIQTSPRDPMETDNQTSPRGQTSPRNQTSPRDQTSPRGPTSPRDQGRGGGGRGGAPRGGRGNERGGGWGARGRGPRN
eukprot:TRINITY_DN4357_c0_g1_i2.p1 TRINITY_DN4357_c0_g1~~TRINITY_DN4357_c0_g1_i2.p1  ORF type:complete len:354 (-),score=77.22 TRINITY_DN4357_c0_g1_i2:136-1197(-)